MPDSVWYRGVLLGTTKFEMRSPGPNVRVGQLDTAADFDRVWPEIAPVVDECLAAAMAMGQVMAELPAAPANADPAERGRQIYEHVSGHPSGVRVRAANAALASLGLELRDDSGQVVPTDHLMVQEVKFP